jgi:hypothetical protein
VNAAACQYAGRCEETTSLPFSGVDLRLFLNDLVAKRMIRQRELDRRYVWLPWGEG